MPPLMRALLLVLALGCAACGLATKTSRAATRRRAQQQQQQQQLFCEFGDLVTSIETHVADSGAGAAIIGILEVFESDFGKSLAGLEMNEETAGTAYQKLSMENKVSKTISVLAKAVLLERSARVWREPGRVACLRALN